MIDDNDNPDTVTIILYQIQHLLWYKNGDFVRGRGNQQTEGRISNYHISAFYNTSILM